MSGDRPFEPRDVGPESSNGHGSRPNGDYGYHGVSQEAESAGSNVHEHLKVLSKRRWSAITAFVVVLTLVVIRNFTVVPMYEATARVLVEAETLNLVDIQDVIDQGRSLDAELAILRSRWLAKRTVESLGLLAPQTASAGAADTRSGHASDRWAAVWAFASKAFGIGTPESEMTEASEDSPPAGEGPVGESLYGESVGEAQRINAFLGGLAISFTAATSGVLDIKYRSSDAVLAARFANTHAQEYINQSIERRFSAVKEVTDWLADRLAEQRQKVDASEHALASFREENGLTAIEGASPTMTRLNELTVSLTQTQAARLEKDAVYTKAVALRGDPESLDQLPLLAGDQMLRQRRLELEQLQRQRAELSATLRPRHPDMLELEEDIQEAQAGIEAERNRLIESLRQDFVTAQAAEAGLANALEQLKLEATAEDRKGVQLSVLLREAESNRQIYDLLLQRARETGVAKEITPSRTRVLDRAIVPRSPFSPNRRQNILRGLLLGLVLGVAVAFGLERLDNRIKSPDEITAHLGLPFIGLLPEVPLKRRSALALASNGSLPQFSEELRRIRTNVLFSLPSAAPRSLVVSSTSPREGKTMLSSGLAIKLAQAGERVLLVDADMRRPRVHAVFSVAQEPGLSNVLVGESKLSLAVRKSSVPNLWILSAGRCPPNPSELLGSAGFRKLLAVLERQFTWILFDTPPVMAVTDACVLAHIVSGVVFVVGSEKVSRQMARRAVAQIAAAKGTLVGGVLNRVAVNRNRYYYSTYAASYGRKYQRYYGEPQAPVPRRQPESVA